MKLSRIAIMLIFAIIMVTVCIGYTAADTTITVQSADNVNLNEMVTVLVTVATDENIGSFQFDVDNRSSNALIELNKTFEPQTEHVDYSFTVNPTTNLQRVIGSSSLSKATTFTGNVDVFSIDVTPNSDSVIPINITHFFVGDMTGDPITNINVVNGTVRTANAPVIYSVTNNFDNTVSDNSLTSITGGQSYSANISAETGYRLDYVHVSMGGVDITEGNVTGGHVTVESVTGNLVIESSANPESVYFYKGNVSLVNVTKDIYFYNGDPVTISKPTVMGAVDKAAFTAIGYEETEPYSPIYPFAYNISPNSSYEGNVSFEGITYNGTYYGQTQLDDGSWVWWSQFVNGEESLVGCAGREVNATDVITLAYGSGTIDDALYIIEITVDDVVEQEVFYDGHVSLVNVTKDIHSYNGDPVTISKSTVMGAIDKAAFTAIGSDGDYNPIYPFAYNISYSPYYAGNVSFEGITYNGTYYGQTQLDDGSWVWWSQFVNGEESLVGCAGREVNANDVITLAYGSGSIDDALYIIEVTVDDVVEQEIFYDGHVSLVNVTKDIYSYNGDPITISQQTVMGAVDKVAFTPYLYPFVYNISYSPYYAGNVSFEGITYDGTYYGQTQLDDGSYVWWSQFVNGEPSLVGCAGRKVNANDVITLAYGPGSIDDALYIIEITVDDVVEQEIFYDGHVSLVNGTKDIYCFDKKTVTINQPTAMGAIDKAAFTAIGSDEDYNPIYPFVYNISYSPYYAGNVSFEGITYNGTYYGMTELNSGWKYWQLFVNGNSSGVGYAGREVNATDVITLAYTDGSSIIDSQYIINITVDEIAEQVVIYDGDISLINEPKDISFDDGTPVTINQLTAIGAVDKAAHDGNQFTYNISYSSYYPPSCISFDGVTYNNHYYNTTNLGNGNYVYWKLYVNGESSFVGYGDKSIKKGDLVTLAYGDGSSIGTSTHIIRINVSDVIEPVIDGNSIVPSKATVGTPAVFSGNISVVIGDYVKLDETAYSWNFGDGTSGTGKVVEKTYGTAGTYTVSVTATANNGAVNTTEYSVTVGEAPKEITAPKESNITAPSTVSDEQKPVIKFDESDSSSGADINVTIDKYEIVPATAETEITNSGKELPPNSAAVLLYMNVSSVEGVTNEHSLGSYAELQLNLTLGSYTAENISFFRYAEGSSVGEKLKSTIIEKDPSGVWAVFKVKVPGFSAIVASVNEVTPEPVAPYTPVTPSNPSSSYSSRGGGQDTGSGNYNEYGRNVNDGGYVDFGTSPTVTGIELPKGTTGQVKLVVTSAEKAPEGKKTFTIFEITAPKFSGTAKIYFKLADSKISAAGFDSEDVCLYHKSGSSWEALKTYLVKSENGVSTYYAETSSVSPFAIVFEEGATDTSKQGTETVPTPAPTQAVSTPQPSAPASTSVPQAQPTSSPAPIFGLAAALGALIIFRKR